MRPPRTPDPKWIEFIARFQEDHGYPPTLRDIQRGLGISSISVVDYWVHRLCKQGQITSERGRARTIRIIEQP